LTAVINVLVAGIIALFFLDGADQIILGKLGVIFDPQITGLSPDVFHDHDKPPVCSLLCRFLYETRLVLICGIRCGEKINTARKCRTPEALSRLRELAGGVTGEKFLKVPM
jgi:hypothetical protein